MKYQVVVGINNDEDLVWAKTLNVQAGDDQTAVFLAGILFTTTLDPSERFESPLEVLAVRSEAEYRTLDEVRPVPVMDYID